VRPCESLETLTASRGRKPSHGAGLAGSISLPPETVIRRRCCTKSCIAGASRSCVVRSDASRTSHRARTLIGTKGRSGASYTTRWWVPLTSSSTSRSPARCLFRAVVVDVRCNVSRMGVRRRGNPHSPRRGRQSRGSGAKTTDQLRTTATKLSAPQRSTMDTSDKWFPLDHYGGPIWGSRGREFKSRQPDQTMADCHA
jgi:hypothetical protein